MKILTEFTDEHIAYWAGLGPVPAVFEAPQEMSGCIPARAIVTASNHPDDPEGTQIVRVGWKPDEIELAHLAQGGTIWLSTWGGLPPHMLEVQAP